MARYEISIGPCYCPHCGKYTLHSLVTTKKLDFAVSIYELPFFFAGIKKRIQCCECQTYYKIDKKRKKLIEQLKKSNLLNQYVFNKLWNDIGDLLEKNDFLNVGKYSEQMLDIIEEIKSKLFWQYSLPEEWYTNMVYFVYDALKKTEKVNKRLYGD